MKRIARVTGIALLLPLVACGKAEDKGWLGYVQGDQAMIAAPDAGWVSRINVKRGDVVREGDLLFVLEATREAAQQASAVASAQQTGASMAEARSNLAYAKQELARQTNLRRDKAGVAADYDLARYKYQAAEARIHELEAQGEQNRAGIAQTEYQLSERQITARTHGRVQDVFFRQGEYAPPQTPVIAVLAPENIFVRFFIPEEQFASVRQGQKVAISCDGCAPNLTATITFISDRQEFTPPVIFSVGNREKLVFKAEAHLAPGMTMNPGQPVSVRPL